MKERKIFSFRNFRGIDTNKKALKIAPFRASEGYNFIIQDETLKSRPAFKPYLEIPFVLGNGQFVIDWYIFQEVYIYVLNNDIKFFMGNATDISGNNNFITSLPTESFNFEGRRPMFKEEKEVLFIFGLGYIFVFASKNDAFYFYELSLKNNEVEIDEELPYPYEPTLFIDSNRLDDVNLLSNVSKYQLFAKSKDKATGGKITYYLPTHFDKEKHGDINEIEFDVEFYNKEFFDKKTIPVFLGIKGEDFDVELSVDNVEYVFANNNIVDTFYPKLPFKYREDDLIYKKFNLDRETFFTYLVEDFDKDVYSLLLDNIDNLIDDDQNVYTTFILPYQAVVEKYDENDMLIESTIERDSVEVYVLLSRLEAKSLEVVEEKTEAFIEMVDLEGTPTFEFNIPETPINFTEVIYTPDPDVPLPFSQRHNFRDLAITEILNLEESGNYFFVAKYMNVASKPQIEFSDEIDFIYYETSAASENPANIDFPDHSGNANATNWIKFNGLNIISTFDWSFYQLGLSAEIRKAHKENPYLFFDEYGNQIIDYVSMTFFAKVGNKYRKVTYQFELKELKWKIKHSYELKTIKIKTLNIPAPADFYKYEYKDNQFKLRITDHIFNYSNQPAIKVRIVFEKNEDYKLITNNRFGIDFGSENRLFLAGNEEYPNIDRYNVSNDLLGDNAKNQSYELSYFPSKNYRVVGDKGKILGYVIAADSHLYISKEDALYIRERILNESGQVSYFEYRTSITKQALNDKCLVRFNNDILMLTKDGLYSIVMSDNILTNERLVKLRSEFVNKELIKKINEDTFIVENNEYLYIVAGKDIFVIDTKYYDENGGYEFVWWKTNLEFVNAKAVENEILFLEKYYFNVYNLENGDYDELISVIPYGDALFTFNGKEFVVNNSYDFIFDNPENYAFSFNVLQEKFAFVNVDYEFNNDEIVVINDDVFAGITNGDKIYFQDGSELIISDFEENERSKFTALGHNSSSHLIIDRSNKNLFLVKDETNDIWGLSVNPYSMPAEFITENTTIIRIISKMFIKLYWLSPITDLGNNLFEKTMFNSRVYASRLTKGGIFKFGYKTMYSNKEEETETIIATGFNFNETDFNLYALSIFSEYGMTIKNKLNNFLYIQFLFIGIGEIEVNGFEVMYKLNRLLKSVG